jgi:tetratricopeptide (TPR) repeat protein
MARKFRSLLVSILALWHDLNQKRLGAAAGIPQKRVSQLLRGAEIEDDVFERLLTAMKCRPGEVPIVMACLEGLRALEESRGLTAEELAGIEETALGSARLTREGLQEILRRLSCTVPVDSYPVAADLVPARWRAAEQCERLKGLPEEWRLGLVQVMEELQSWALCEAACEESVDEAAREVESAASWARLAREIAEWVRGPEAWRNRLLGYAMAHEANALRVAGELKAAETTLEEAKRLWQAGSDPVGVLDPGRLLDLEGPLRTAQRRFEEALNLLDQARDLSRCPGRTLLMKGFTLEVMGEYERAIAILREAAPLVGGFNERRLKNILHINLAINLCHVGLYTEAAELVAEAQVLTAELGDEITLIRLTWLRGRIAAGLGRAEEARRLLAEARQKFATRGMTYDVALALLEEAVLLLAQGRAAEVKALAPELAQVFDSKGVHREALAALRLFAEAADQEEATAELTSRLLRYLFRARYDEELRFNPS